MRKLGLREYSQSPNQTITQRAPQAFALSSLKMLTWHWIPLDWIHKPAFSIYGVKLFYEEKLRPKEVSQMPRSQAYGCCNFATVALEALHELTSIQSQQEEEIALFRTCFISEETITRLPVNCDGVTMNPISVLI